MSNLYANREIQMIIKTCIIGLTLTIASISFAATNESTLKAQREHVIQQYIYDLEKANLADISLLFTAEGNVISTSKGKINARQFFAGFFPWIESAKTELHQTFISKNSPNHYAARFHLEFLLTDGENGNGEYVDEFVFAPNSNQLTNVYMFENLHVNLGDIEETIKTVRQGPIANTYGYDIHYVILDGETQQATEFKEEVEHFISSNIDPQHPVYLGPSYQTNRPMGPWNKPVWEIKLATISESADPSDPAALDEEALNNAHNLMLKAVKFSQESMIRHNLHGTLLIHANTWPENTNQSLEHDLHFKKSWVASGETTYLKDIWTNPGGLIDQENFVIKQLQNNMAPEQIINEFKQKFHTDDPERSALMLINARENLRKMHERMKMAIS
jgi:hypothetical protein